MANKLLSAIEDGVFLSAGSVPVVIEGIEHTYDTGDSLPSESAHNSHELLYLRDGEIELSVEGGGKMNEIGPHHRWAEKIVKRAEVYGVVKTEDSVLGLVLGHKE